jgi:chromosome partitioning protein
VPLKDDAPLKILAITNIKGGVGKTTSAVNLAFLCAAADQRTVLWDLDPQGAATYVLGCEAGEQATAKKLVTGKRELPELVVPTGHPNLDMLPSDFSYRKFDVHLAEKRDPTERLLKMSRPLRETYDALFLDCPAGISLLSENVLRAADAVIVPIVPTPLSVRMLLQLRDFINEQAWDDVILLPFFSMVDRRRSMHEEIIAHTRKQVRSLLSTEIPYSSVIERMTMRRAPLPSYSPRSEMGLVYRTLWKEIADRVGLKATDVPGEEPAPIELRARRRPGR